MGLRAIPRVVAALAVIAAFITFAGSAAAQADSTAITLHSRVCPAGQPTTDIFTDCHSHLPTQTTSYSIDGGTAQKVGNDGNLTFDGLTAGTHKVAQQDGIPLDFAHLRVFCSDQTAGTEPKEVSVDTNSFSVKAVADHEIVCDVYTIPENASGNPTQEPTNEPAQPTATSTRTSSNGGTTQLPNTGTGSSSGNGGTLALIALIALVITGFGFGAVRVRSNRLS